MLAKKIKYTYNKDQMIQHRKRLKSGNFKYTLMYGLKGKEEKNRGKQKKKKTRFKDI